MARTIKLDTAFWLLFFIAGLLAALVLPELPIPVQAAVFLGFVLYAMSRSQGKGLLHPLSWFTPFYFLYAVSYPLYTWTMGVGDEYSSGLVIPISFTGYMAFSLAICMFSGQLRRLPKSALSRKSLVALLCGVAIICCALLVLVATSGVASKREFIDFSNLTGVGSLFVAFQVLALVFALMLIERYQKQPRIGMQGALANVWGVGVAVLLVLAFGLTGERDYLFRILLFTFIVAFSWRYEYRSKYLILAIIALVLLLPLSQAAKAFLLSGDIRYAGFEAGDLYRTEFASAGRNLAYVIENPVLPMNGETFWWDIQRYVGISDQQGTGAWFNTYLRAVHGDAGTSGWGFSLVAEGYINFGLVGVFVLLFTLGLATSVLYRRSSRSMAWFAFYLMYIPVMIYVLRADLANYLSLAFKVNVVVVVLLFSLLRFMNATKKWAVVK